MINNIIDEALIAHDFRKDHETDTTSFYIRESGSAIRFAILHKLDALVPPVELNSLINQSAPESFISHPTFKKNCDLICVHHVKVLSDFKKHESKIFAIEEDPHFFKKYVLYYSDAEESAIKDFSYDKLVQTISDKGQFSEYKSDPLVPSQYSVAAKIFIKFPFLELPFNRGELVSLRLQAAEAVSEAGLDGTYETIQKMTSTNVDELIKELIDNEMENISN